MSIGYFSNRVAIESINFMKALSKSFKFIILLNLLTTISLCNQARISLSEGPVVDSRALFDLGAIWFMKLDEKLKFLMKLEFVLGFILNREWLSKLRIMGRWEYEVGLIGLLHRNSCKAI